MRTLREALTNTEPPDDHFVADIQGAIQSLEQDVPDPWLNDEVSSR